MEDHDQRFKTLLREFFLEFFLLFFPTWAERFDFSRVTWLDKEVFTDPPGRQRRILDLVAKVPTRQSVPAQRSDQGESWIALIHVEIEQADKVAPLRPRMFEYYVQLRRQHRLPVLPIALYLGVGLDGLGIDTYIEQLWDLNILRFDYLYVGLPALEGEQYLTGNNPLGVALAARMRIPQEQKARLRAEAIGRIMAFPDNNWRRFLLCEFVQASLPLNEEQQREFDDLLATEPYKGVRQMATTWFEQGIEKGKREFLQALLDERFGPLSPQVQERLQELPPERIQELGRAILKARSLQELGLDDSSQA